MGVESMSFLNASNPIEDATKLTQFDYLTMQLQLHTKPLPNMKSLSLHFSLCFFVFLVIFSILSSAFDVLGHATTEEFVRCLSSLHPQDSSSIIYTPNNSSYSSVLGSTI
ncbi:hypothetical protein GQ457_14G012710 [Hibiscus cannabinus]